MPYGTEKDPVVAKISVYPEHRVLPRHAKQQFAVYAHYTDGAVEDITRRAQYESNDAEVAAVEGDALVRTLASFRPSSMSVKAMSAPFCPSRVVKKCGA